MTKKISVPMPDMRIATLGSKPISSGASTVAPNIAITCCTPRAAVCGQGRRSSGATTAPAAGRTSRQLIMPIVSPRIVRVADS
jgi:hypothetical protein